MVNLYGKLGRLRTRSAAFLHDLGKVGVPTDLLLRAGALDPSERSLVEQHPEIGQRLLEPLAIPAAISSAVRHHHEWWDGTGYPDGLSGEKIPLAARIIGVVDAFDAMSSDRPYRRALDRAERKTVHRVHPPPPPHKLEDLARLLERFGIELKGELEAWVQRLESAGSRPAAQQTIDADEREMLKKLGYIED